MIDPKLFSSEKCTDALDKVVLDYLLRAGHNEVAEQFSEETGVHISPMQKEAIAELRMLSAALDAGNTRPILQWASAHSEALRARNSSLEYDLLRTQFLNIAQGDLPPDDEAANGLVATTTTNVYLAFLFGRRHFEPYLATHLDEIQSLYSMLLFLPKFPVTAQGMPLDQSLDSATFLTYVPWSYRHLLVSLRMDMSVLSAQFRADFCALAHIPQLCALRVTVDVGVNNAIGRINKVRNVMKERGSEWSQSDEIPVRAIRSQQVEIPLPPELQLHSTFLCPVSKETGTENNPPMMMPCGHVLCRDSLHHLARGSRVKCPYCPLESEVRQALRLYL